MIEKFFLGDRTEMLDYSDVLIVPRRSSVGSRRDVSLVRRIDFPERGVTFEGIPIMAANMDTIGTLEMAHVLCENLLFTCLSKTIENDDILEFLRNPNYPSRENFVAPSLGISSSDYKKFCSLYERATESGVKINYACIDVANGHMEDFTKFVRKFREEFKNVVIIAGNVVTSEGVDHLIDAGADIIKVGIGPGSACLTRTKTGVGFPQLSAVYNCAETAGRMGRHIVADGGCVSPGDISKAFVAGSSFVMVGGMLSGHDECLGEVMEFNGKKYKEFYGMSSEKANKKHFGGLQNYRTSEGREVLIPYRGPVINTIIDITGGIRSTCAYVDAKKIEELERKGKFVRVNNQINNVFSGMGS